LVNRFTLCLHAFLIIILILRRFIKHNYYQLDIDAMTSVAIFYYFNHVKLNNKHHESRIGSWNQKSIIREKQYGIG